MLQLLSSELNLPKTDSEGRVLLFDGMALVSSPQDKKQKRLLLYIFNDIIVSAAPHEKKVRSSL
jgi:hypothetical protein